jgi:hypothetical protein
MCRSIFHRSLILPFLAVAALAGCAAPTDTDETTLAAAPADTPDTGETGTTREGLSASAGPSDFVATNLSNAGMWVTIYNTFGRIVTSGCVEPGKMVFFSGLFPVLPHEVRLELTTYGNCQGPVFRQLWLTVSIGAFGNGWLDSKYEWHGSIIPPIPALTSPTAEEPTVE